MRGMTKAPRNTKEWLRAVASHLNLSLSDLAIRSGLAASTVTRYVNDASGRLSVTDRTLDAIAEYSGIPRHHFPGERRVPGLGESEAVRFDPGDAEPPPAWVCQAVEAAGAGQGNVEAWVMKGWALDLLGVLPGDILLIDPKRRPRAGNIVCVQLTDPVTGGVEIVFRRYEPPFVVAHSAKMGALRPETIDEDRVVILGVETGIIRPRH